MTFKYIMQAGGKMNIKPLFDRVIIKPEQDQTLSKSGIILPETSQDRPQIGEVVAVGDGTTFEGEQTDMKVKVGDKVVFNKYIGNEIKIDNETHVILRQIDIIGVVND